MTMEHYYVLDMDPVAGVMSDEKDWEVHHRLISSSLLLNLLLIFLPQSSFILMVELFSGQFPESKNGLGINITDLY